jgi:hypothetical protein
LKVIAIIVIQVEKLDLQIYFLDTQVWYTVMSALVGALEGARMGLGEVSLLFFLIMNLVWDTDLWVRTFVWEAFENPLQICVNTNTYKSQ